MSSFPVSFVIPVCGDDGVLSEAALPRGVALAFGLGLNRRGWSGKTPGGHRMRLGGLLRGGRPRRTPSRTARPRPRRMWSAHMARGLPLGSAHAPRSLHPHGHIELCREASGDGVEGDPLSGGDQTVLSFQSPEASCRGPGLLRPGEAEQPRWNHRANGHFGETEAEARGTGESEQE